MDPALLAVAFGIGIVVGLTGMGGGALMTPVLVLFFNIPPLTAVSSDVVASAAMKPAGSWVHWRNGTVNWTLVKLLVGGSVPAAFLGVLIAHWIGPGPEVQAFIKHALGYVLMVSSAGLLARAYLRLRERAQSRDGKGSPLPKERPEVIARPIPTIIVGVVGGLMVGLTSVGSGSLIIVALMALYPTLKASQLVGTDLVQAVPLVFAAAIAHLIFGDVDWSVTWPIIIGSIPGAYIGAHISSRVSGGIVRRALAIVLMIAGLKLIGVSNEWTLVALAVALVGGTLAWGLIRRSLGFSFFIHQDKRRKTRPTKGD
ncbi:sulfite exporter TauE/SafE family protein [Demequina sp. SYSU T00039]|uniref:Probable membrane transporter protein n=1 Tax=Demequina lignilytica TaxID=3051663 RepID=A0AAW7M8H5_9MICO|nr:MULTISPECIES: sulfite exporter TauE/SafE family protein [unclassified Demequina]MDN4477896.1 sulfite exporter TauE/SafE family protein [Demequina sp. SYSU T00039-1]MDN4487805.1 sulfite exporter TauE/SafE family protein [Demequina sp. SYSU T00039]